MESVTPIIKGLESCEFNLAEYQDEYHTLRALAFQTKGIPVMTRWRFSAEELQQLLEGADLVLTLMTFDHPFQPVHLQVCMPDGKPIIPIVP